MINIPLSSEVTTTLSIRKGFPALDYFASDYKKMHTSRDHLESIDFEKLTDVTKLIYLTAYEFLTEP